MGRERRRQVNRSLVLMHFSVCQGMRIIFNKYMQYIHSKSTMIAVLYVSSCPYQHTISNTYFAIVVYLDKLSKAAAVDVPHGLGVAERLQQGVG